MNLKQTFFAELTSNSKQPDTVVNDQNVTLCGQSYQRIVE